MKQEITAHVVIVDEAMEVFEKVVDGYVSHEEGLKQLKQMQTEQELEDAAEDYYPTDSGQWAHRFYKDAFKKGANWQKQQSATDAIEFSRWISDNGYFAYTDNKWVHVPAGSKYSDQEVHNMITDKELYELWQQSKDI